MTSERELAQNRDLWAAVNSQHTDDAADTVWNADEITWGLFSVPEASVQALGEVRGRDVVELGCGTAYFAAWLARRGARAVGVDLSPHQLATARRCQQQYGPTFPLVEADATDVPLPSRSFDLVVSEYGASAWCDPVGWLAEAARLLRPGGRLVFLANSVLATLTVPADGGFAGDRLLRAQRGTYRIEWPGGGTEYHPSHGEWISLLRRAGFAVQALHELYAPDSATTPDYYVIATAEWARSWPAEDLWVASLT
ncbi:MAG: class I SAM-dependent methyltransferase [Jiangellales bacterium]